MNFNQYKTFFAAHKEIEALAYEYAALEKSLDKKLSGKDFDDDYPIEYQDNDVIVHWTEYWGGSTDYGSIRIDIETLLGDKEKWAEGIKNRLAYDAEAEIRKKAREEKEAEERKAKAKEKAIADAKELLKQEGLL
ncbi:MAG: hypothetical protein M0R80_25800 [Proteobacteria bacterium]|nr:hypothetical protein [Pseudomonadota bacterium]